MCNEFWKELNQENNNIKVWCSSDNWGNENGGGLEDLLNITEKLEFKLYFDKNGDANEWKEKWTNKKIVTN